MKKRLLLFVLLALMLGVLNLGHALTVQVGNNDSQTNEFPVKSNNGGDEYSYTQQIYTQTQINSAGPIDKIRFYFRRFGPVSYMKDWTIYMGHTQKTSFNSNTDWESMTNLTQVFIGEVLPSSNNYWLEITLDTPFHYNNVDNLLIAVHEYTPGDNDAWWGAFNSGSNTGIAYEGYSNPNPNNPPTAIYRSGLINCVQLNIANYSEAPMAPLLVSPENGAYVANGQSLSWTLPQGSADATGYDVYIDSMLVSNNQSNNNYTLTNIGFGEHSWYVVAHNSLGSSAESETCTFTIVQGVFIGTENTSEYQSEPFSAYWSYARSMGLYTHDQIGQYGMVNTLGWKVLTPSSISIPYKIYAKIADDANVSYNTWDDFASTATLVKEGSHIFDRTGWHNFALDTPIYYTHGHLLVGVEANYGSATSSCPYFYFDRNSNYHKSWRNNSYPPTDSGYLTYQLPHLFISLAPIPDDIIVTSYPWTENFDSFEVDQMPANWTIIASHDGADDRGWEAATDMGASSEPHAAVVYSHDQYDKDEWMISLPFVMQAGQAYYISFKVKGENEALALHWGRSPTVGSVSSNAALYDNNQISYANWTEERVMFIPSATGVYYFGWHAYTPVGGDYIAVDDISVCLAPDLDLAATDLSVPVFGHVDAAIALSVSVKNWGGMAQSNYTIFIKEQITDTVLAQELITDSIGPGDSKVYTVNWTPTTPGNISIYAEVDATDDVDVSNNSTTVEQVLIYPANMQFIYVGNPSSTLAGPVCPFNLWREDFVAETVYLANEIQATEGELQAIAYYNNFPTAQSFPVQIWMQNTDAMSVRDGWLPWDGYQLVFDGTIECPAGFNEIVIPITHFNYTGSNLAIRTSRTWDGGTVTGHNWLLTRDSNYSRRTRIYQANISDLDHANPTAGSALDMVPNINLYMGTDHLVHEVAAPVVELSISWPNTVLEWELVPYAHSYNVYYSVDPYCFSADPTDVVYGNSTTMPMFTDRGFFKVTSNTYRDFGGRDVVVDRFAQREFIVIDDELWAEPNEIEKAKSGFRKIP